MLSGSNVPFIFPPKGFIQLTARFPPSAPLVRRSPTSSVLSGSSDFSLPVPLHFVSFARRYHAFTAFRSRESPLISRAWTICCTAPAPSFFYGGNNEISQVPGEPLPACSALRPRWTPDTSPVPVSGILPSARKTTSAPQPVPFRGSITQPADPLCTLRSIGHPNTTQHSVPAGG